MLSHPSLLRATKGDAEDIETSLVSQIVAEQQLELMESETKEQTVTPSPPPSPPAPSREKVKRKEINWEPQQLSDEGTTKETKITAQEEIEMEKQKQENREKLEEVPKSEVASTSAPPTEQEVPATPQTLSNHVEKQSVDKQKEQQKDAIKEKPPTVIFKQLKQQYQSISEKLKQQEEKELQRRTTLESRKRDAAKLREARQSQKLSEIHQKQQHMVATEQPVEEAKEIVIQLDQMGSYTAFDDRHKNHHSTSKVSLKKRQHSGAITASSGSSTSPGDDEYYQQMNTIHDASEAT